MDSMENKIKALLIGDIDENEEKEFLNVDYTLEQQNYELSIVVGMGMLNRKTTDHFPIYLAARGIDPKVSNEFRPKIGLNITFVVTAVIFNKDNDVLMMQEAKSTCAGSWYLPAGRVEPYERLEDAVKRGVLKETGLDFEPTTILLVESSHGNWFRFVYTGMITGGTLKTASKADQESLQACYVDDVTKLDLRSQDCLRLIELGREYVRNRQSWHIPQLTIHRSVPNLFLRLLVAVRNKQIQKYQVLISDSLAPHLPLCEINPTRSIHSSLKRFMQNIFGQEQLPQHKPIGILIIEHDCALQQQSDQYDGLCLTLLVMCKDSDECLGKSKPGFTWTTLGSGAEQLLLSKLSSRFKTIMHAAL